MVIHEGLRRHPRLFESTVSTETSSSNDQGSGDDLLVRGFHLAYFLHPNRSLAIEILENALDRLDLQRGREKRRTGWRNKSLKRKITRIVFARPDALQWLIYFESTQHEKQRECRGQQTTADMIVYYIKNLVQFTTGMSSFYVNVGIHRLLHDYSISEAHRIYELSTQHYTTDAEYRRVKGVIMEEVQARFGDTLRVSIGEYRERRFELLDERKQEKWADWVNRCLEHFIPWSTKRVCMEMTSPESNCGVFGSLLSGEENSKKRHDVIEIRRCHVFISPSCHAGVTQRLGLVSPGQRLAVPRFFLNDEITQSNGGSWGSRDDIPTLTAEERKGIRDRVSERKARRKQIPKESLRILADGAECARLDVFGQDGKRYCELREGVKLIEICTEVHGKPLPFAIHWIDYMGSESVVPTTTVVDLENAKELVLRISPIAENGLIPRRISLRLQCRSTSRIAAWKKSFGIYRLHTLPKYALGCLSLVAVGWVLGGLKYSGELAKERATLAQAEAGHLSLERLLEKARQGESIATYRLIRNGFHRDAEPAAQEQVVPISARANMIILELPVDRVSQASYAAVLMSFADRNEILAASNLKPTLVEGEPTLSFPLPASLVEDGKDYSVEVYSISLRGTRETIRTFTFSVEKE